MGTIRDIMQVGVDVTDREKFEKFARDILGLHVTRSPDGKVTYVRPDQYQHRIAARAASEPAFALRRVRRRWGSRTCRVGDEAHGLRDRLAPQQPGGM